MSDVELKRKVVNELTKEKEREALKAFYRKMNETALKIGCSRKTNLQLRMECIMIETGAQLLTSLRLAATLSETIQSLPISLIPRSSNVDLE